MIQKSTFNHFDTWWEIKKQLTPEQYVEFDKALCKVQFLECHIDDITFEDRTLNLVWIALKHTIKQSLDGFFAKKDITYDEYFKRGSDTPCDTPPDTPCDTPCDTPPDTPCQHKDKDKDKDKDINTRAREKQTNKKILLNETKNIAKNKLPSEEFFRKPNEPKDILKHFPEVPPDVAMRYIWSRQASGWRNNNGGGIIDWVPDFRKWLSIYLENNKQKNKSSPKNIDATKLKVVG